MARFVLRNSILSKILLIPACVLAAVFIQPPVAMGQRLGGRVGGGARPIGGTRMAPQPRMVVPPVPRTTVSRPRVITGMHLTSLGARFGRRPGPNNLFLRRRFFRPLLIRFEPAFGFDSFSWQNCGSYWVWGYSCSGSPFYGYGYGGFENYTTLQPYEAPVYQYSSEERDLVWLYLKDGTAYRVSDYWFVNGQARFIAVEEGGAKSVEQTIPFGDLDVQKTVEVNARRGFRVVMRDEPIEQYMRDHPDLTPPLLDEPPPGN